MRGVPLWSWQGLAFFAGLIVFGVLIYLLSPILARRRIERWAISQRLRLLDFRTAPIWDGPRAWTRNRYKLDYRIVVEDSAGRRREGWLLENWPFLDLGRPNYQVLWDD